jgi:site-specific DNA-methyltransferase (adenine-specific)
MIEMIQGDNMDYMKTVPDGYFELAIVDPPYGIKQGGDKNNSRGKLATSKKYHSFDDNKPPTKEYFSELQRISKHQIIWGANHFISLIPFNSSCWIVWDKVNGKTDFADCELAWTNFDTSVRKFSFQWQGMLQGNMKHKEPRIHPTQKPVALYKWLLQNYAKQGDKIFDSHGGSGSICIACEDMGFDLVWIEKDKDYYRDAVKRYKEHKRQGVLFTPKELFKEAGNDR